jgi:nucleotide-binding universal stress UspA family protein
MEPKPEVKPYIIVVGIDHSELGRLALHRAFEIANRVRAGEPHVVHVASIMNDARVGIEVATDEVEAVTVDAARNRLNDYVRREVAEWAAKQPDGCHFERVCTHQRVGFASEEIARLASDLGAELVIVSTHGRRGISRLLMGSVAEGTVRLAPCPVLVVRPKQASTVPAIEPPCPRCVEARKATAGTELWCEQHRVRHGPRHTYHHVDRNIAAGIGSTLTDPLPH